jgi:leucyl-tRNA---protein transferase
MRMIEHLVEAPRACSYLGDRRASLEHRVMLEVGADALEEYLVRGWRRFGPDYFRPRCGPCSECVPMRLPVATFAPSKSQRRARAQCAGLTVVVGRPIVDEARIALYHRWHASREHARGWTAAPIDGREYFLQFAMPHEAVREIAYYDGVAGDPRCLVGLGICDVTKNAWSAVYFFYDPKWADKSIGVANVMRQIDVARELGQSHVYLGYYVAGCPSMSYKNRFRPRERLIGWPELDEAPVWTPAV